MVIIGQNIRFIRRQRRLSLLIIAGRLNMSVPALSKIELGMTDVNLSRLEQIAAVFDMSVIEVLTFHKTRPNPDISELDIVKGKLDDREAYIASLRKLMTELFEELYSPETVI